VRVIIKDNGREITASFKAEENNDMRKDGRWGIRRKKNSSLGEMGSSFSGPCGTLEWRYARKGSTDFREEGWVRKKKKRRNLGFRMKGLSCGTWDPEEETFWGNRRYSGKFRGTYGLKREDNSLGPQ